MAKMTAAEAKTFLKGDVGLTDDQLAGYTDAHLKKVAEGLMRQSDYDRVIQEGKAEIDTARATLETANQRLSAEMAEWAQVQAEGGRVTAKMRADLEKAQADVLKLTQTVTRVATDAGMDPAKVLEGVVQVQVPPQQPVPNLDGYVKADVLSQHVDGLANLALKVPVELMTLAAEHQALFGKQIDANAIVTELQKRAGTKGNTKSLDLRNIWEEQNKVPEARQVAEKKRWDDAMADAEKRGREAAASEIAIPGSNTPGKHAPVFQQQRQSAVSRPQPGSTVNAAVAAFRTGKYRVQSKTA